ncbi:MAG: DUF2163 domain-containing protein [Pseudomonadota bacterium]
MAKEELFQHLQTGVTTTCQCWALTRRDGKVFGFTDHDRDLAFDGIVFKADTGLTARALQQSTGLSVDNSEALGALSHVSLTDEEIAAGRYDGAGVVSWLVNWTDVEERMVQFRGSLGEITRSAGGFRAELRGLSEALNRPVGRVYQGSCSAILGDASCRFDLDQPGFVAELTALSVLEGKVFEFGALAAYEPRWFERGRLRVLDGSGAGLVGVIKNDRTIDGARTIETWEAFRVQVSAGVRVRLEAGCDKRRETCKAKFANILNFRGFPHIPGEDWMIAYPTSSGGHDGGSLAS